MVGKTRFHFCCGGLFFLHSSFVCQHSVCSFLILLLFIYLFFCLIDSFTLSTQGKRNLLPVETALKQNNTKKSTIINTHLGLCYAVVVVGVAFLIHCCFLFFSLLSLLTTHLSIETQTKQTRDGCVLWYYTTPHRPPPSFRSLRERWWRSTADFSFLEYRVFSFTLLF